MISNIGIIGAGSWGTALAKVLGEKGLNVSLWVFEKEIVDNINKKHFNPLYLSKAKLPSSIKATNKISEALVEKEVVLSVVPSRFVRNVFESASSFLDKKTILVSATKGIELKTNKLMSEVLAEVLPNHPAKNRVYLSGPSFADEVAKGLPTSIVVAGIDGLVREKVQNLLKTEKFLVFTNEDIVGVEISGAVKNVIAIASGMSDGLGFGHNTRAAIITRGLYEIIKIGKAMGANPLTFVGLSGIGDLILTCTADMSRNHRVGRRLGQGEKLEKILSEMKMVAEGVSTSKAVYELTKKYKISVPICEAVYKMLYEELKPIDAVKWLCSLPIKDELRSILK